MRQLTLDWSSKDRYVKLRNFRMEVMNMFQNYDISQAEEDPS